MHMHVQSDIPEQPEHPDSGVVADPAHLAQKARAARLESERQQQVWHCTEQKWALHRTLIRLSIAQMNDESKKRTAERRAKRAAAANAAEERSNKAARSRLHLARATKPSVV